MARIEDHSQNYSESGFNPRQRRIPGNIQNSRRAESLAQTRELRRQKLTGRIPNDTRLLLTDFTSFNMNDAIRSLPLVQDATDYKGKEHKVKPGINGDTGVRLEDTAQTDYSQVRIRKQLPETPAVTRRASIRSSTKYRKGEQQGIFQTMMDRRRVLGGIGGTVILIFGGYEVSTHLPGSAGSSASEKNPLGLTVNTGPDVFYPIGPDGKFSVVLPDHKIPLLTEDSMYKLAENANSRAFDNPIGGLKQSVHIWMEQAKANHIDPAALMFLASINGANYGSSDLAERTKNLALLTQPPNAKLPGSTDSLTVTIPPNQKVTYAVFPKWSDGTKSFFELMNWFTTKHKPPLTTIEDFATKLMGIDPKEIKTLLTKWENQFIQ